MATRVTPAEVKDIIDTDLTDLRIQAMIDGANQIITKVLGSAGLAEELLKEIERWLSAHYIAATFERQAIHEVAGPAEQKFSDVFKAGLDSTTYGQTAKGLDPTGALADMGMKTIKLIAISEQE